MVKKVSLEKTFEPAHIFILITLYSSDGTDESAHEYAQTHLSYHCSHKVWM